MPLVSQANSPIISDKAAGMLFGSFFLFVGFMIVFGLFLTVLWILMLIHAAKNDIPDKVIWILLIVLLGALGAIIYYFVVKRPFDQKAKQTQQTQQQNK